jgi:hypothetical protein
MDRNQRLFTGIKRHAVFLAALAVLAGLTGFVLYQEQRATWVTIPESAGINVKQDVFERLQRMRDKEGLVEQGAFRELMDLMDAEKNRVTLYVAEADFQSTEIGGLAAWKELVSGGAILVNSVDEFHRNDGGTSKPIAEGCGLQPLDVDGAVHQIGEVRFEPCKNDYLKSGIQQVANVALVLWKDDPARAICKIKVPGTDENGYSKDADYRTCISTSAKIALAALFRPLPALQGSVPPTTLLLPALATGTGAIHPEVIYQAYLNVLGGKLADDSAIEQLPRRIVFLLWRNWTAPQVLDHEQAIANLIDGLNQIWVAKSMKFRQVSPVATLLGILCGFLALTVATIYLRSFDADFAHSPPTTELWMAYVGWGLAAQGAAIAVQPILVRFFGSGVTVSFLAGAGGIVVAWFVSRANKAFGEIPNTRSVPVGSD